MSEDLQRRLDQLRRKIARIDARWADEGEAPGARDLGEGREVETELGKHWEVDHTWPAHHRHGAADVGALSELPEDLLQSLAGEEDYVAPAGRWAFLDTETSGLSGGSGAFAFLVGVGAITAQGFELKQFFMRDHGEEPSMLAALASHLSGFDLMVTYNGRGFDQPLLETRYRLARQKLPFGRLRHVDLLYSSRRLWRLALDSCRLQELERRILGVERVGDVGGAFIPALYFDYLRSGDFEPLKPVLKHNAIDILSLACLTAIVPAAFRDPARLKNGAEMVALSRWMTKEGRTGEALALIDEALKRKLDETLLWETLWRAAEIERKLGRIDAAVARWNELATARNARQAAALERLSLHFERREKNPARALELAESALALGLASEPLVKRVARLRRRVAAPPLI